VATLTVVPDTIPPTVVRAVGDVSLDTVVVTFSEPIFAAANLESYFIVFPLGGEIQGGDESIVTSYAITNGNRTFVLTVSPPRQFGSNYGIYISDLVDISSAQNVLQPNPSIIPVVSTVQLIGFDTDNEWKYSLGHTAASNLHGTGWEAPGYDDSAWLSGPAGLGRDTGQPNGVPIRTLLPYTTDEATALNVTTYFRKRFYLPSTTNGVILRLRDVVEDGAVYYLNGQEIFRNRMPGGPVSFVTTTPSASEPQPISGPFLLPSTHLQPGENLLAAEVHQNGLDSSDMEFAAELLAEIPSFSRFVTSRLKIILDRTTGAITVSWPGAEILQATDQLQSGDVGWTDVPGNPNPYIFTPSPGSNRFFRLRP